MQNTTRGRVGEPIAKLCFWNVLIAKCLISVRGQFLERFFVLNLFCSTIKGYIIVRMEWIYTNSISVVSNTNTKTAVQFQWALINQTKECICLMHSCIVLIIYLYKSNLVGKGQEYHKTNSVDHHEAYFRFPLRMQTFCHLDNQRTHNH